jgi:hypothetical protein
MVLGAFGAGWRGEDNEDSSMVSACRTLENRVSRLEQELGTALRELREANLEREAAEMRRPRKKGKK